VALPLLLSPAEDLLTAVEDPRIVWINNTLRYFPFYSVIKKKYVKKMPYHIFGPSQPSPVCGSEVSNCGKMYKHLTYHNE
jgi:hypothetical protein